MDKNRCPLEGASSGTPLMILSKISQHLQLSKRGSKAGLVVINAPAKYAATYSVFSIKYIFLVNSWCELVFYYLPIVNTNLKYVLNENEKNDNK